MDGRERREIQEQLLSRARQVSERYDVNDDRVRHYVDRFAQSASVGRSGYIAGTAHATLLELAEAHVVCVESGCRVCHLLGEAVAQILAREQVEIDEQFADLAREADRTPRSARWPWQRHG
jgi:hypothetical protein